MKLLKVITFWLSALSVFMILFDLGFDQSQLVQDLIDAFYIGVLILGILSIALRYTSPQERPTKNVWLLDVIFLAMSFGISSFYFGWITRTIFSIEEWIHITIWIFFLREFFLLDIQLSRRYLNPAQLFIAGFILMILSGTLILMLPRATYSGISFIDALFTSTSAVCVTGLIVVDTGSYFTSFGQFSIMILIQLGGLGIMTLTSYFSYFFRGGTTYENQLLLKDMTNADKIAEVFETLKKILVMTFLIEAAGFIIIYYTLDPTGNPTISNRLFFSIFHAISSFCNAGFSTLKNSLYEYPFRYNYSLQLIIALLFIIGGLGFPIIFNFARFVRYHLHMMWLKILRRKQDLQFQPWIVNINTRIVLITTMVLTVLGTFLFFISEYNNTLSEHTVWGKLVTAFFSATTPRTAGFNSIDFSAAHFSSIMLIFFLMWIGASPASTGGGIKTSTLALAILNFVSIARGKTRIEIFRREVSQLSVRRSFAIISLSLLVIGLAVFFISWFDEHQDLLHIAFECFSAYSTVGLSLGITAELSAASKIVLILTMFIGRVGMLTVLIAIFRKIKDQKYRYPSEEILIN